MEFELPRTAAPAGERLMSDDAEKPNWRRHVIMYSPYKKKDLVKRKIEELWGLLH